MQITRMVLRCVSKGFGVAVITALLQPAFAARLVDQTFPLLKTRTATYTNVTVTTRAEDYIFIVYDGGMTSVKVSNLSPEARHALGYASAETPTPSTGTGPAVVVARESANPSAQLPAQAQALKLWQEKLQALHFTTEFIYTVLAIVLLIHLGVSYCFSLICSKTGNPGGLLVWLPALQWVPLFRAAGMSGWWFFGFFIPILNIVAPILWSINIVKARGKSVWVTVMLLLPVTSIFAFLYLAFSNEPVEEFPAKKFPTRAAQATA